MEFHGGFKQGGQRYATSSTASTYTLTNTEMMNREGTYWLIDWTANVNTTLTTQATSSMFWLGNEAGDTVTQIWANASTTAGSTITFAAGTGVDLQEDEGETVVLNGLEYARVTFMRKNNTDVAMWVEVSQVGD
jgi:hypothetical protein